MLLVYTELCVELLFVLTLTGAVELAITLLPEDVLPDEVITFPVEDAGPPVTVPDACAVVVPELVFVVTVVVVVVTVVLPLLLVLVALVELEEPGDDMVSEDEVCVLPVVA